MFSQGADIILLHIRGLSCTLKWMGISVIKRSNEQTPPWARMIPFQNAPPMPRSDLSRVVYREWPVDKAGYHFSHQAIKPSSYQAIKPSIHQAVVPNNFRIASYLEMKVVSMVLNPGHESFCETYIPNMIAALGTTRSVCATRPPYNPAIPSCFHTIAKH
jgi:hypothetical protein